MADPRLPAEMDAYITTRGWGEHHDQWHYEQRYDFYRYLAAQGDQGAQEVVDYGDAKGWQRAPYQEGAPGHGIQFLAMHRAMFQLLAENFPQHYAYLDGWPTPPQDPNAPDDIVVSGEPFPLPKSEGVIIVETRHDDFADEDGFALFLETNIRPTPTNPAERTPDARTALHNFLHNRWSDGTSPVNLGDPKVNLMNARFWRLHGWIDRLWTRFRQYHHLSDTEPTYVALIASYRHMMEHGGHHVMSEKTIPPRPERLTRVFAE